jgi:hypothetical protein
MSPKKIAMGEAHSCGPLAKNGQKVEWECGQEMGNRKSHKDKSNT